jgi:hypothetical protein
MRLAAEAGVSIIRNGETLLLQASNPPTAELVALLRLHKPGIIALLNAERVRREAGGGQKLNNVQPIEAGADRSSSALLPAQGQQFDPEPFPQQIATVFQLAVSKGGEGGEGGEGGVSDSLAGGYIEAPAHTDEADPNPDLPRPQPGETVLPGWGCRVSMEYRLRTASVDECLEWAREPWQLKLVAKAFGYSKNWVDQILLNRETWKKAFALRDAARA